MKMHEIITISTSIFFPDVFLRTTYNKNYHKIRNVLFPVQKPSDRPDIFNQVFQMEHRIPFQNFKSENPFGDIIAQVSVIEFQQRGLPHARIVLFGLESQSNIQNEVLFIY